MVFGFGKNKKKNQDNAERLGSRYSDHQSHWEDNNNNSAGTSNSRRGNGRGGNQNQNKYSTNDYTNNRSNNPDYYNSTSGDARRAKSQSPYANRKLSGDYSRQSKGNNNRGNGRWNRYDSDESDSDESDSDDSSESDDSDNDSDDSAESSEEDSDDSSPRGRRGVSRRGRYPSDDSDSAPGDSSGNDSDFDGFEDLKLSGSAQLVKENREERLRLTSSTGNQFGTAWFKTKKDMSQGFEIKFTFVFSEASNPPGEGIAFVIQNSRAGPSALGDVAGGLGYGGIENSIAIELDTHQNQDMDDPNDNHISIQTRGPNPNSAHHQYSIACESRNVPRLVDGTRHTCRIAYNPEGRRGALYVYLDNMRKPLVTARVSIDKFAPSAYLGFTGSTGAVWAKQDILHFKFRHGIPADVSAHSSDDDDDSDDSSDSDDSDSSAPWNRESSSSGSDDSGDSDNDSSSGDSDESGAGSSDYDDSDDSESSDGFSHGRGNRRGVSRSGYDRKPSARAGAGRSGGRDGESGNVYTGVQDPHGRPVGPPRTKPSGCGIAFFCGRKTVSCGKTPASALRPPNVRGATPKAKSGRLAYRASSRNPDSTYAGGRPTHLGGPSTPRGGQRRNLPVSYQNEPADDRRDYASGSRGYRQGNYDDRRGGRGGGRDSSRRSESRRY